MNALLPALLLASIAFIATNCEEKRAVTKPAPTVKITVAKVHSKIKEATTIQDKFNTFEKEQKQFNERLSASDATFNRRMKQITKTSAIDGPLGKIGDETRNLKQSVQKYKTEIQKMITANTELNDTCQKLRPNLDYEINHRLYNLQMDVIDIEIEAMDRSTAANKRCRLGDKMKQAAMIPDNRITITPAGGTKSALRGTGQGLQALISQGKSFRIDLTDPAQDLYVAKIDLSTSTTLDEVAINVMKDNRADVISRTDRAILIGERLSSVTITPKSSKMANGSYNLKIQIWACNNPEEKAAAAKTA